MIHYDYVSILAKNTSHSRIAGDQIDAVSTAGSSLSSRTQSPLELLAARCTLTKVSLHHVDWYFSDISIYGSIYLFFSCSFEFQMC